MPGMFCLCPGPAWDNTQVFMLEGKCFLVGAEHLAAFPASSQHVAGQCQGIAPEKHVPSAPVAFCCEGLAPF